MKMEVLPSDRDNLEKLLDAFGSVVSLHDIASAYCESGRDLYTASQILCDQQSTTSMASSSTSEETLKSAANTFPSDESLEKANNIKSKSRKAPASMGTISGAIGRDYGRTRSSAKESWKPKPLKLNSNDIPISEIWDEKDSSFSMAKSESLHDDIQEFLFQILGDGFRLERTVIQDIVGQCGYDANKSIEKLLELSASTVEKSDEFLTIASEIPNKNYCDLERKQQCDEFSKTGSSGSPIHTLKNEDAENHSRLPNRKDKSHLQKEILDALFTISERSEKVPAKRRTVKEVRRPRAFGRLVEQPLNERFIEDRSIITIKQTIENDEEENGDDYEMLRRNVMEYQRTMKEYYKSAVDAYAKTDHERAKKLLEEGHFFMQKAREAEEKSAQKLLKRNDEEEMIFDLHDFDPKEAVRLLKVHLISLSGISSLHVKVLAGSNDEDANHERRKRMITKLLDRENIRWSQEGDKWTIVMHLAEIDPKNLSFAKK